MAGMKAALSVREFVAPLEPSGSIDARRSLALEEDPMAQGARLHARVQKRLARETPGVQAEVAVKAELERDGFQVLVRGRIDVLLPGIVEEIKTTFRPAALLEDLQAQQALTQARSDYVTAVAEYDKAQYALRRATGGPPASSPAR